MTIAFSCLSCGHVIRVGDQSAGKRGKCPKCHTTMTVPLPSAAPPVPSVPLVAAAPAAPAADPHDPFANFAAAGDEPLIRRPTRRRRSKVKTFIVLLIFLILLGGGGYFAYYYFFGVAAGLTEEERYFPSGVQFVASARPVQLFGSGSWKEVKAAIAPAATAESMAAPLSPLPLNQVERITFAGNRDKELVFFIRATKALAVADVQKGLSEMRGETAKFKEVKVGNYTMYESDGAAFCLVSSRLLVASTAKTLKAILERDRKPDFPADFQTAFKAADFSRTFACAVGCKGAERESGKPGVNLGFLPHVFRDELASSGVSGLVQSGEIEGIALDVDVGSDVTAKVSVFCKDAKMAEDLGKAAEGGLAKAKIEAKEMDIPKELVEIANSIKVSASDRTLRASATIKVGPLLKAAKEVWQRGQ